MLAATGEWVESNKWKDPKEHIWINVFLLGSSSLSNVLSWKNSQFVNKETEILIKDYH